MIAPVSPLHDRRAPGDQGPVGPDGPGVVLSEISIGALWQIAPWPGRVGPAGAAAAAAAGAGAAPGPGRMVAGSAGRLLRVAPLGLWLTGAEALPRPALDPGDGVVTDLGHARTLIRIDGPAQAALLARLVPLDLRETAFAEGTVATTGLHHVGVTLCRRDAGVDLYVPRSFARALWDHIAAAARQFGLGVGV